jgi:hypothetical protein
LACAALLIAGLTARSRTGEARTVAAAVQLDYAAAPGCPSETEFEAVVEERLGYVAFHPDAPDRVVVHIDPVGRTLEGRLEWQHAAGGTIGEQVFPSRTGDCTELTRAMAFALAVQLQLMAKAVDDTRKPPPPAPVAPPPTSAPPPAPVQAPPPAVRDTVLAPRPSRRWFQVGAGAALGLGVSSTATGLGRLFGTVGWTHFALELSGEASLPSTVHRGDGAGFSQTQLLAGLAGCAVAGPLSACAVGKAGSLRVAGQGVDLPMTTSGPMVQSGLRLAAWHGFGHRLYIVVRGEGLARLTRRTVTLDALPVWTTPRFLAELGIDLAIRFE